MNFCVLFYMLAASAADDDEDDDDAKMMWMVNDVWQKEALEAVKSIEVSGVTNMSAGIFTAISQFNVAFAKRLGLAVFNC